MEFLLICIAAFMVSGLTLFAGFGLGTMLMPVFAIFFPVNIAIGLTAVVHLINSLFRSAILVKFANKRALIKFGLPAIFAAIIGAYLLSVISKLNLFIDYQIFGYQFHVALIKFIIAILIIFFIVLEFIPKTKILSLKKEHLAIGGILSGFFGGLSGHQGAFRSVFLIQANLSKEEFIASNMVIAALVDITRIIVYGISFPSSELIGRIPILTAASLSAILGSFIASHFIEKITIKTIRIMVFISLFGIAIGLITGII
ncbi:MAG: hypothetical protein A2104_07255 [Candidatus Melainabacteria bacterium GWF2_32_7]|nr:MAG: hypothetical protein A2104_07255 [Candidatus Melainabacteria bacterium GWF2_32_7]